MKFPKTAFSNYTYRVRIEPDDFDEVKFKGTCS
jgi:hypothetical protein